MGFEIQVDDELTLRLVEPQHAEEIYQAAISSREHIARWLPWMTPSFSLETERAFAERCPKDFDERKQLTMSLLFDGRVVGGCGLTDWRQDMLYDDQLSFASADIGYWLVQSYTGRGLMTRTVRALTTYAIQEFDIRRLTIRAEVENTSSWKVAERLGYVYEGTLRDVSRYNGRPVNHKLYSMLAEEWTP